MNHFSVAITTFNRPEMTLRAIKSVINNPLCDEIVIVDDSSTPENVDQLRRIPENNPDLRIQFRDKVKLIVNPENMGMSRNKNKAIYCCKNQRVLILDSDNYLLDGFYEAAQAYIHMQDTILLPEKAMPEFIYSEFVGRIIDGNSIKQFLHIPMFEVLLNTGNYIVPREKYHSVYEYNEEIKETDVLWFNYLWLKAGCKFFVVPGMDYIHEVHAGSAWLQNMEYNLAKGKETIKLINDL
jgi:glycosyltransferase involved in cell wall biosynthesis